MDGIKTAIQKAIEGGYLSDKNYGDIGNGVWIYYPQSEAPDYYMGWKDIILDPLFWQSLGKALGWDYGDFQPLKNMHQMNVWEGEQWLYEWHRFIDWIAEGKSSDDFFRDLLST